MDTPQSTLAGTEIKPTFASTHQGKPTHTNMNSTDWKMQTKPTPFWKFLLGANIFKKWQLDYVEKEGETIIAKVRSGAQINVNINSMECTHAMKNDLRTFTIKNSNSKDKVVFMEVHFQMPEEWWDDLAKKLNSKEPTSSKVMGIISDIAG